MEVKDNKQQDSESIENARIGYQAGTTMWSYEGVHVWSKFNAMLITNSILITTFGLLMSAPSNIVTNCLKMTLPIAGLILSVLWFVTTKRGFEYSIYWVLSTRELEEKYLKNEVNLVSRGGRFAEGKTVKMDIGGKEEEKQLSCIAQMLRARWVSNLVIVVFVLIYIMLLVTNLIMICSE